MLRFRTRATALAGILGFALMLGSAQPSRSQTAKPDGVSNFAQVADNLYRGAQPNATGFASLHQMGIAIVVNFRNEGGETRSEKAAVEALGMKYVSIPWSGASYPSDAQVAQFLEVVRANPGSKIFAHCLRGADRTGTMIAAYRIAFEHKSSAEAVAEMHRFHYDHFFLPQLQRYVNAFPQDLQTNAVLSAYAPAPEKAAAPAITAAVALPVIP